MTRNGLGFFLNWLRGKNLPKDDAQSSRVFVIGYPKAGNTWLRVMLGKYVQLLIGQSDELPLPLFDRFEKIAAHVPPLQFTHGPLEWTVQTSVDLTLDNVVLPYRHAQVVLLVRSIPDVLVSLYWQEKTRSVPQYPGDASIFIHDPIWGVEKALAFYQIWNKGRDLVSRLMLLRYEDLRSKPEAEFRRFLEFLQVPINEDYLAQAVAYSDFHNMRTLELNNLKSRKLVYPSSGFPIFATGDIEKTQEAFHVRKGQVGGYREYLSESDVEFLRQTMKEKMPEWFGYVDGFYESEYGI